MVRLKVVIADDHVLFQQGLKLILESESSIDFEVLGCASTGKALLELLKSFRPDLIFLDLNMPSMDGLDAYQQIKEWNSAAKVIVLTMYDDPKIVKQVLKTGVDGYILKKYGKAEILKAVTEIIGDRSYISKGLSIGTTIPNPSTHSLYDDKYVRKYRLTKRELQILQLISQALSNKEIAKELYISDQTVSVHRKNIMKKLNVSNTAGLIKVAYNHSLIF